MKSIDIFPWDDHFETGLPLIDTQHRRLVDLLNQLAREVASQTDMLRLYQIFDELLDYTVYHFEAEEKIWGRYFSDDPLEVEHIALHQSFIDTVVELKTKNNETDSLEIAEEALGFLARWLASHILETDRYMAYIALALEKGASMDEAKIKAHESMSGFTRTLIDLILSIYETLSTNTLQLLYEIRKQKQLEKAVEDHENQLHVREVYQRTVLNNFPFLVWLKDTKGRYLTVNEHFAQAFEGLNAEDIIGKTDLDIWPYDLAQAYRSDDTAVMQSGYVKNIEEEVEFKGKRQWMETYKSPVIVDGVVMGTVGFARNITARKETELKLELAASVFIHAAEGIMITTADGTILDVNQAFTHITGYNKSQVIGKKPSILKSGQHTKEFYAKLWKELINKGYWYGEIWNRRANGEAYVQMITISAIDDKEGGIKNFISLFSDITMMKEHQRQLEHIAHYDALTGLANRVLFGDRLNHAMLQTSRRGHKLAVAYLDLDGFKEVNDHYGHEAGDKLLMGIASNMKNALREGDTLARLGGDEFVMVLHDLDDIHASIPSLERLLQAASEPIFIGALKLQVSASLGVTFYPQDEIVEADQLLRQADQAMYNAKLEGKNRFHFFDAKHDKVVRTQHEAVGEIRSALQNDEFILFYQPKVNMRTGQVVGAEALIRWNHPMQGILSPISFLPYIEDHSIGVELGEWVIQSALAQIGSWEKEGLSIPISVNISARQFQQNNFVNRLQVLLELFPEISPSMLEIEVLETSALEDIVQMSNVIQQCKEMGVKFALDDFGTGYSSLTYLKHLPVSTLKIDQSFVRDMLYDSDDLAILEGILGLGNAFRRHVIAEGVESIEQGEMLLQLGCEWAQGYVIARPMRAIEMVQWSQTWQCFPQWCESKVISNEKIQILYGMVEHRSWVGSIEAWVSGHQDSLPSLDSKMCRFGEWMSTPNISKCINAQSYEAIAILHEQIHVLGAKLVQIRDEGNETMIKDQLTQLFETRDALNKILMALLKEE